MCFILYEKCKIKYFVSLSILFAKKFFLQKTSVDARSNFNSNLFRYFKYFLLNDIYQFIISAVKSGGNGGSDTGKY